MASILRLFLLVCAFACASLAPRQARALDHTKPFGEPYELLGKRVAFTTWYFVRPGQPQWYDPRTGREVSTDIAAEPFEMAFRYLERPHGVRLIAERPRREGPIIPRVDPKVKTGGTSIFAIVHDGAIYRAWGGSSYYESKDGRNWDKPKSTNYSIHGSVFIDPAAPPEQRFKTVRHSHVEEKDLASYKRPASVMSTEPGSGWRIDCIVGATSPDGLTWTELPEPLSIEPSDTMVGGGYDARSKKYLLFTRSHMVGPRAQGWPLSVGAPLFADGPEDKRHQYIVRRAIGRGESSDFARFPLSETIIETSPDMAPSDTYYSNCYTTVPGAPDQYLMFPAIYHQTSDTTTLVMFTSHDNKVWHRAPGPAVLETPEFGSWDGGCVFSIPNLIELADGDWALPYTGYSAPHKYPRGAYAYDLGYAIWPKGRMMAIEAAEEGAFTTVAVLAPGTKLRINAVTARAGSILVEAAGLDGKPIDGRSFADAIPIVGDQFRTLVKWKDGVETHGVETGKPIVLRFRLARAKLYGLDFE